VLQRPQRILEARPSPHRATLAAIPSVRRIAYLGGDAASVEFALPGSSKAADRDWGRQEAS
jgi:hypothetical protein